MRDARKTVDILATGGLLTPDTAAPEGERLDAVVARRYVHPALGDRPLVRLIPEALAPGADAEMTALGFADPVSGQVVGLQRRRAPGFPGWALLNDPKNAKYALEVVKDLKKAARLAVSKPGHARDEVAAIGVRLARTTPHFLPSYWEEVGRVFLGVGNLAYAAQSFEKAREAERQFALAVDEQARADAFVEFALSGALSAKSLLAYARTLSESADKAGAYRRFRELCARRTLGGAPPFSGMGKELRGLSKAAGLDVAAEERAFLREVLTAPAIAKSPAEAWKVWGPSLKALAAEDAAVSARLVDLFPEPATDRNSEPFHATWLDFLAEAGCLARLAAGDGARAAAWFRRLLGWLSGNMDRPPALLRQLAPRLIADAAALDLVPPETWRDEIEPTLLETALELGVPLVTPGTETTLDLSEWAKAGAEAPELLRIAADARFGPLIERSVDGVVGDEDFELAARGKASLREPRRAWLLKAIAALGGGGFPSFFEALETLEEKTGPDLYAEFPDALAALKAVDPVPVLARTLRAGLFDELGWPALEEAYTALRGAGPKFADVDVAGCYPWLVLANERKAVVLGASGVAFTHDLKLPKRANVTGFRYSGGQLLVVYRDENYDGKGYWSGRPSEVFDVENHYRFGWRSQPGVVLATGPKAGLLYEGRRPLAPGDTQFAETADLYSDGTAIWVRGDDDKHPREAWPVFHRLDLATGQLGALERPPFFESFVAGRADRRLGPDGGLWLLPAPPGLGASPLGLADGMVGIRCRSDLPPPPDAAGRPDATDDDDDDGEAFYGPNVEVEGTDGRSFVGLVEGSVPDALLLLPGRTAPLAVTGSGYRADYALWEPGATPDAAVSVQTLGSDDDDRPAGTPVLPKRDFWHFFTDRDPAGSAALRQTTEDVARAALAQATADIEAAEKAAEEASADRRARRRSGDEEADTLPREAVRAHFAGVTHPGLVSGVAEQLARAHDAQKRLRELYQAADEAVASGSTAVDPARNVDDSAVIGWLGRRMAGTWYGHGNLSEQLAALLRLATAAAAGEAKPGVHPLPHSTLDVRKWLGRERGLAWLAAMPAVAFPEEPEHGAAPARLLPWLAELPWVAASDGQGWVVECVRLDSEKSPFIVLDPDLDPDDYEEGDPLPVVETWIAVEGAPGAPQRLLCVQRLTDDTERPILLSVLREAGDWTLPEGAVRTDLSPVASAGSASLLRAAAAVAATPLRALPADLGALVAAETGLSAAECTYLFAGVPQPHPYAADFLGKELREALGLKTTEAKAARAGLEDLDAEKLLEMYAAACPEDPAELLAPTSPGADGRSPAVRLGAAFRSVFGSRVPLPEGLLEAVGKLDAVTMDAREFLTFVARPADPSPFSRDGRFVLDAWGNVERADEPGKDGGACFDAEAAVSLVTFLMFALAELPPGDAFRINLRPLVEQARARLGNPDLLFALGTWYAQDKKEKKRQKAFFESLGGEHWAPEQTDKDEPPFPPERGRDTGLLRIWSDEDGDLHGAWRPSRLRDAADREALAQAVALFEDDDARRAAAAVALLWAEPGAPESALDLAAAAAAPPSADGRGEADPRVSAPETVAAAAAALKVSAEAATLYLQLLAHPRPTQKAVQAWNDWKPAVYKKAIEALEAAGLVVAGKRPRAGREHFLPGGWEELGAPDLPLETWKIPLYGLRRDEDGDLVLPFGQIALTRPMGALFRAAFARIEAGDRPALEEIKTGRAAARAKGAKGGAP